MQCIVFAANLVRLRIRTSVRDLQYFSARGTLVKSDALSKSGGLGGVGHTR